MPTAENSGPQRRSPRANRKNQTTGEETQSAPTAAQQPPPTAAKPTLEQFISQHDKLLGAMAVLAALSAFMKDLQIIGGYLSFIFTVLVLLVWFELLTKFPKQSGTSRLVWFENLLTIGVLGLVLYLAGVWLVAARETHFGMVFAVYPLFMAPALWASVKLSDWLWLRRFTLRGERDRFTAYFAIVGPAAIVANIAAAPVTGILNSIQPPAVAPTRSHSPSPTPSPPPSPTPSPTPPAPSPVPSVAPT